MSASDIVDILPSGNAALPAFIPIVQKAAGIHFRNTVSSFSRCGLKGSSLDNLIKSSTSEASAAAGSMLMSESTMNRQASTAAFLVAVPLMALYKQRQSADPTPIFNLSSNQRRHLRRLYALAESTTEAEESVDISEIPAELVSATSCFLESLAIGEIQPSATQAPAMIQLAAALCISKSSQSQVEPHLASPRLTHLANSLRMLWLAPHLRSLEAALDDSCLQTSILAEVQKQRSRLLLYSSPIQAISHRCSLARKVAATRPSPKRTIWSEDRLWVTPPAPNARPIEWTKVKTTVQGLICEVARLMSYAFNVPPTDLLDIVLPTNIDDRSASVPFVDKVPGDFITQLWSDYHISISNDETLGSLFDRLVLAFACANHACCGQPGRLPQLLTTSLVNTEIDPKSLFWDSFRQVFYWVGTSSKGRASFVAYELPASLSKLLFLFCCVRLRILSRLQNQVCDQSASSPYLFSFSSGSRVTPDEVAAMFVKCFQDSTGQPVSPASFRHLTISRFVQNSRNETRMVARVLKGEDVSTEDFLATLRETVSLAEKRNRKLTDAELCARMR